MAKKKLMANSNLYRSKNNLRLLLKPFGSKLWHFKSLMVTVSRHQKTLGNNWTHLNIASFVSCVSLAKHCMKLNTIVVVVTRTSSKHSKVTF